MYADTCFGMLETNVYHRLHFFSLSIDKRMEFTIVKNIKNIFVLYEHSGVFYEMGW